MLWLYRRAAFSAASMLAAEGYTKRGRQFGLGEGVDAVE